MFHFPWPVEMANVLALAERRKQITAARVAALLEEIQEWSIQIAREHNLTAYDGAYLELAIRWRWDLESLGLAHKQPHARRPASCRSHS